MRHSKPQQSWHLKRLYGQFNRLWFNGSLPSNTCVRFKRCNGNMAEISYVGVAGIPAVISIAPILRRVGWDAVAMSLLHEMVHLSILQKLGAKHNHGHRFNEKMLDLAKRGAFNRYW